MGLEIFKFGWFYGSEKLLFTIKLSIKSLTGKTMLKVYTKNNKITSLTENYYLY